MAGGASAEDGVRGGVAGRRSKVFFFNPFTECYVAGGGGFTPVRHQLMLAEDLANLPQYLCSDGDMVLVGRKPSDGFLEGLVRAGFVLPAFVEFSGGDESGGIFGSAGEFRPWGWGPDSLEVYELLLAGGLSGGRGVEACFNEGVARLYSKVWAAEFLRRTICEYGGERLADWCCGEAEIGVGASSVADAMGAISSIRHRGHHRVVVKEEYGMAGQRAVRLWEEEVLPTQLRWMEQVFLGGRKLIVEPWLERECDFSIQLEMGLAGLEVCGYTGLLNDHRGQFRASWAESGAGDYLPERVRRLMGTPEVGFTGWDEFCGVILRELELELRRVGFLGPIGIDALIYRGGGGETRVKPVVEINPRYTMGRVMLELRRRFAVGSSGVFRLLSLAQVREAGYADFAAYTGSLKERCPLRVLEGEGGGIVGGAVCLNDPERARVCLAVLEVGESGEIEHLLGGL